MISKEWMFKPDLPTFKVVVQTLKKKKCGSKIAYLPTIWTCVWNFARRILVDSREIRSVLCSNTVSCCWEQWLDHQVLSTNQWIMSRLRLSVGEILQPSSSEINNWFYSDFKIERKTNFLSVRSSDCIYQGCLFYFWTEPYTYFVKHWYQIPPITHL